MQTTEIYFVFACLLHSVARDKCSNSVYGFLALVALDFILRSEAKSQHHEDDEASKISHQKCAQILPNWTVDGENRETLGRTVHRIGCKGQTVSLLYVQAVGALSARYFRSKLQPRRRRRRRRCCCWYTMYRRVTSTPNDRHGVRSDAPSRHDQQVIYRQIALKATSRLDWRQPTARDDDDLRGTVETNVYATYRPGQRLAGVRPPPPAAASECNRMEIVSWLCVSLSVSARICISGVGGTTV